MAAGAKASVDTRFRPVTPPSANRLFSGAAQDPAGINRKQRRAATGGGPARVRVELRVLGQVEVLAGGTEVELGHARQRYVLGALLIEANQVVSTDGLVDRIWGERPPRRARQLVSNYL